MTKLRLVWPAPEPEQYVELATINGEQYIRTADVAHVLEKCLASRGDDTPRRVVWLIDFFRAGCKL